MEGWSARVFWVGMKAAGLGRCGSGSGYWPHLSSSKLSDSCFGVQGSCIFRHHEVEVCVDLKRLRSAVFDLSKLLLRAEL